MCVSDSTSFLIPDWMSSVVPQIINQAVSFVVVGVLFAAIFKVMPEAKIQWRDVAVGAFVTAVLFTLGKQVIGLYLGQSATTSSYGAAGSVIVVLLWVYYTSQIVLLGAEFTRLYAERTTRRPPPESFARPDPDAPIKAT